MPTPFDYSFLGQASKDIRNQQKQKSPFDISGTNDLGFSQDYGKELEGALDEIFQRQLTQAQQQSQESAVAGGDFNPNLSSYYATKGAREAQSTGKVQAKQASRADEYNRFNVMNAINNFGLQKGYLDLQKEMYEDSQPTWLDDVFGGLSAVSNIVPFFEEGGEVKANKAQPKGMQKDPRFKEHLQQMIDDDFWQRGDEFLDDIEYRDSLRNKSINVNPVQDGKEKLNWGTLKRRMGEMAEGGEIKPSSYYEYAYGGGIPPKEVNSKPSGTGDNTLIKAQTGEVIQSNPAGDLFGRDNLKLINEAGKMATNLFADSAKKMSGGLKPMANMNPSASPGNIQPSTLGQNFGNLIKGMFRQGGSAGAQPMQEGGDVGSPFDEQINQLNAIRMQLVGNLQQATDETAKSQIQSAIDSKMQEITNLEQQKQQWRIGQNPGNQLPGGGEAPATPSPGGGEQPRVKKIIIEDKPFA